MRFTLHYRGLLRCNGSSSHKHEIRKIFHQQLSQLWRIEPLSELKDLAFSPAASSNSHRRELLGFSFVPLVSKRMHAIAEIAIVLLRPEPAGQLITRGGDIDNRLKTLFDALSMPQRDQLKGVEPESGEDPFFCLLEDDNLITSIAVSTEQLLEPGIDASMVDLTIRVRIRRTGSTWENEVLA